MTGDVENWSTGGPGDHGLELAGRAEAGEPVEPLIAEAIAHLDLPAVLAGDGRVLRSQDYDSLWERYMQGETEGMLLKWLEGELKLNSQGEGCVDPPWREEMRACRRCFEQHPEVIYTGPEGEARPLFDEQGNPHANLLFVAEAPNFVVALCCGALQLSCGMGDDLDASGMSRPVIYGDDDRVEYYQASTTQQGAADSVFLVVNTSELSCSSGSCTLQTVPFTDWFSPPLCQDEPFRTQPTVGFCTAFLVSPDRIATAGHCISSAECAGVSFVPKFRIESASGSAPAAIPQSEIYSCSAMITHKNTSNDDYGVWQLDRVATGMTPLCIRRTGTVATGTNLVIMGHPYTLPLKVADGAVVKQVYSNFFTANLDDYGGNSGSPVFDLATMEVQGILVRGNEDFVFDSPNSCYRSNVCSDSSGCGGWFEEASHTNRIASSVPTGPCYSPNPPVNTPPVANANGPYSGSTNSAISFSSAGSSDSDGTITGYAWTFGDGGTSTAANPSHTYTAAGTYTVTLTVTDNNSATHSDSTTATITVASASDVVTITKAEYRASKKELKVEARSTDLTATLTVVGYGTMSFNSKKGIWKFRQKNVSPAPSTVTVTSDRGGSDTSAVNVR